MITILKNIKLCILCTLTLSINPTHALNRQPQIPDKEHNKQFGDKLIKDIKMGFKNKFFTPEQQRKLIDLLKEEQKKEADQN